MIIQVSGSIYIRIWKCNIGPHYVLGQRELEGVQWCATKLVPCLRDESYIDMINWHH